MATKIAGDIHGVDPATEVVHDVAVLIGVDGPEGPDLAMAPVPVVGMGQVRRNGHLKRGISLNLGLRSQVHLELSSTASDADSRETAPKVDVGHSSDQGRHHFEGVGLQTVVGRDALS